MTLLRLTWLAKVKSGNKKNLHDMAYRWHGKTYTPFLGDPVFCGINTVTIFIWSITLIILGWSTGIGLWHHFNIYSTRIIFFLGGMGTVFGFLLPFMTAWLGGSHHYFRHPFWEWQRAREFCQAITLLEKWEGAKFNLKWSLKEVEESALGLLKHQAQKKVKGLEADLKDFDKAHEEDFSWERPYTVGKRRKLEEKREHERLLFKVMLHKLINLAEIPNDYGFYYEREVKTGALELEAAENA